MKLHEPPNCVTKTVEFSAAVVDYIDAEDNKNGIYPLIGGLSRDNHYAWISRGPTFEVVSADAGEKVAAWTFGGILKDTNTKVTCAVELPTVEDGFGMSVSSLYAVGLDCYMSPGMVCLFDIRGSKVIKAIQVPGKVTSLSVVDPGLIPEATTPLAPPLRLARGILAVGLSPGGQVLLLDLCLSEEDGAVTEGAPPGEEEYLCSTSRPHIERSDELNPSRVVVHAPGDPGTEGPVAPGEHLAIFLNEQSFVNNYFLLKLSENPSCMYRLPPSHVDITASLYVPQLASLFIGFSFGCFQVWDLGNLTLVHTSSLLAEPRNITFFAFQEPADDPKKYCYIWAVYGRKWDKGGKEGGSKKGGSSSQSSSDSDDGDDLAFACMHDLFYQSKEWIDAYGWIYQDFVSIHRRFELELSHGNAARSISRCITCFSLDGNLGRGRARLETSEFDEVSLAENDLSLCCLAWQSWQVAEDGTPCNLMHNLTIFDLNQWYREQMPLSANPLVLFSSDLSSGDYSRESGGSHPGHPHLVTYTLPFVTERAMSANGVPLLFARINPTSISRFCPAAVPIPEEHLYPSALSFESSFLLGSQCVIKMSTPGLQRSLLATLQNLGSKTYLYPTALFHECIAAGLKPLYVEILNPATTPVAEQRKFLLSLALEYHMLSYLIRCAIDTADGCACSLGVTLAFLMSWVKHRSCIIKECISKLTVPLFECGGTLLPDPQAARLMALCGRQLNHLSTLLKEILKHCAPWIFVDELKEIEQWCEVLGILALHAEVVQWFCHVGLLPELADEDFAAAEIEASNIGAPRIPYPVKTLAEIYDDRRRELKSLPGVTQVSDVLFIDGAVRECGERLAKETWRCGGSEMSGCYPPPSLQTLLLTYLLDGLPVEDKHCLVIYLFLDLAALLGNERYASSISQLIKFPSAFSLSPSIIKLTQAFWLLDHKDFENAINMFLEPLICPQDIKLWQHRCVVRAFLSQGEPQKALKYVRVRQPPLGGLEDLKLNLTLLLENGLVHEAFNYQRKHRNDQNSKELLRHFFDGCGDLKELRWVLQNSLTQSEEEELISFLTSQRDAKAHELCIMYYLQRSRFIEALRMNENEKPAKKKDLRKGAGDVSRRNMKTVRDAIVTGYASAMPPVTRRLATYCARHAGIMQTWKEVPRPVPMSVVINRGAMHPSLRTKSTLISTMLDKARETWNPPPLPPIMPPTPQPPPRKPQPPPSLESSRLKRKREDEDGSDIFHPPGKSLFFSPLRSSVDSIPFICTPVAPSQSRSRNGNGPPVFPSQVKSLSSLEDGPTPKKGLFTSVNAEVVTSSPIGSEEDSLSTSALQLLQTPVVPKKNRKAGGVDGVLDDDSSTVGTEGSTPPREKIPRTPHSILKVRKARGTVMGSPSFVGDDDQMEEEVADNQEEAEGLGGANRLIRFQLPTGLTPSPIQWPMFFDGEEHSMVKESRSTPKSPLSRSPIKSVDQEMPSKTLSQPSPKPKPSPSPRAALKPSPAKKPMLVESRKELFSSTKTTTKVRVVEESPLEREVEGGIMAEHRGPRTRSSIHQYLELLKKSNDQEGSGDDSGEFYSFEKPKDAESTDAMETCSKTVESKGGTRVLTDSYMKLFGSPCSELKMRRQSRLFKRYEDDEDEEDEGEVDEEVEEEEMRIEAGAATGQVELEEEEGDADGISEDGEVGGLAGGSVETSATKVQEELELKGEEGEEYAEDVVEAGLEEEEEEVLEVPQGVPETETEVLEEEVEEEIICEHPLPPMFVSSERVRESTEVAKVKEDSEVEEYEGGDGAGGEPSELLELETSEIFSDDMEANLKGEVPSFVEGREEERDMEDKEEVGHTVPGSMEDELEGGEVSGEQAYGRGDIGDKEAGFYRNGRDMEVPDRTVLERHEDDDEGEDGDDDIVVISSSEVEDDDDEDDDDQSGRESMEDDAEAEEDGVVVGEAEEERDWGEYEGEEEEEEEEMVEYEKRRGEDEGEVDVNEGVEKESWIAQWERESGVNQSLWTDQEREEEEEIEEVKEEDYGILKGSEGTEPEEVPETAGLEVVGVKIGRPTAGETMGKSLIKGWEEEYGMKEEDYGNQENLYDEEEEVDDEIEEDEEEEEEEVNDDDDDDDEEEEEDDDDEEEEEDDDEEEEQEEEDEGVVKLIEEVPKGAKEGERAKVKDVSVEEEEVKEGDGEGPGDDVVELDEEDDEPIENSEDEVVCMENRMTMSDSWNKGSKVVMEEGMALSSRSESIVVKVPESDVCEIERDEKEHLDRKEVMEDITEEAESAEEKPEILEESLRVEEMPKAEDQQVCVTKVWAISGLREEVVVVTPPKSVSMPSSGDVVERREEGVGDKEDFEQQIGVEGRLESSKVEDVVERESVEVTIVDGGSVVREAVEMDKVEGVAEERIENEGVVEEVGERQGIEETSVGQKSEADAEEAAYVARHGLSANAEGLVSQKMTTVQSRLSPLTMRETSGDATMLPSSQGDGIITEQENEQENDMVLVLESDQEENVPQQMKEEVEEENDRVVEPRTLTGVSIVECDTMEDIEEEIERVPMVQEPYGAQVVESSVKHVPHEVEQVGEAVEMKKAHVHKHSEQPATKLELTHEGETEEIAKDDMKQEAEEEKAEEEELNASSRIEDYATSRRLTRHQMSLLSRSLVGTESPSTPLSAKRRTKAKTPPRSTQKGTPVATATPTGTPQGTPQRSSARLRSLGGKVLREGMSPAPVTLQPQEAVIEDVVSAVVGNAGSLPTDGERAAEKEEGKEAVKGLSGEKSSPQPWSVHLEERFRKLKQGSPAARKSRRRSTKSVSPQGSMLSSRLERATSESKSMDQEISESRGVLHGMDEVDMNAASESMHVGERMVRLRHGSPVVESQTTGRRTRRLSTKSSSPRSSASTEIRLSPIPERVAMSAEVVARASSPAPSITSTVESTASGRVTRRRRTTRASVDREEEEQRPKQRSQEELPMEEVLLASAARESSPTPSIASTVGSSISARMVRRSTKGRASMEREERPLTPMWDVQRSGRVRRRSETESPVMRRSARLMGSSPSTVPLLSPARSDSEVSGYASSIGSSRSRLSAVQEDRVAGGEELTLRSGRKRAKLPSVTPTKSGPRKKRDSKSSAARFLVMPIEENEGDESIEAMETAFIFSPPTIVASDPSGLDVPKEIPYFSLSPPKMVPQPSTLGSGHGRSLATRRSVASLGSIPEDGGEDVVVATPPPRRGRSSLEGVQGTKITLKHEEFPWGSPRRGAHKGKSKVVSESTEEKGDHDIIVSNPGKKRTRRSSASSLQPIEESKVEEDISSEEVHKRMHPILRKMRSSPTSSVVSEGALDRDDDVDSEDKESSRAKDDSDTLPRRRKRSSRKTSQPRKVIVPYKPRRSAKL